MSESSAILSQLPISNIYIIFNWINMKYVGNCSNIPLAENSVWKYMWRIANVVHGVFPLGSFTESEYCDGVWQAYI